jgi:hypothetical protein
MAAAVATNSRVQLAARERDRRQLVADAEFVVSVFMAVV